MKIKYLKFKNWLIASIASMLGLNLVSCDKMFAVEYGEPYAKFEVKGKVTDPEGNPIAGIEVGLNEWKLTTTSQDGKYSLKSNYFPESEYTFNVAFNDVDSTENGLFKNDTLSVTVKLSELTGGSGWYEGSATKTVDVTLERLED